MSYAGLVSMPLRSDPGAYVYRGYRVRRVPGPGSERHRRWVIVGKESVFGSFPSMRAACETIDMLYPRKTPS